jgi:hypothetical protein
MGTAGSSKGSGSNTSLVPTWLDEPAPAGPLPGNAPVAQPGGEVDATLNGEAEPAKDGPRPVIQPALEPKRFQNARGNFTAFARSGGNDRAAMRRAVRDYVRTGRKGNDAGVRRMGSSRVAASGLLGVFRGFQRDGVRETLQRLNLSNLVGRSTRDVFIGLTEVICREGGAIDDAIARDAWLETVIELDRFGIGDLNALTSDQVREIFLSFVTNAMEAKLMQEVGVNGFKVADQNAIQAFEAQFHSYIERSVRDSFASDVGQVSIMTDQQIRVIVDRTYREAWDLLEVWGDQE